MAFLEKDKKRGQRHARSVAIRITRTHKKVHLGEEIRPEGRGAKAPGVLAKTGIRTSQPTNANWRKKQAAVALIVDHAVMADQLAQSSANQGYARYMSGSA